MNPIKNLKFIWKIVFFLNLIFILFLLFAYLSIYIDPSNYWWFALFGLLYPISLLVNLCFIVFWLFIRKRLALFSTTTILLGFFYLIDFFAFHPFSTKAPEDSIKIMSYNVRLFDLYNWQGNKETKDKIFDFLKTENSDIICFQEFYENHGDYTFKTKEVLVEILDANQHYEKYTHKMNGNEYFGVATYSKYPIVNAGFIDFIDEETNACIFTDLKIDKDTIRVYNTHMGSIRFNAADYKYLGDGNTKFKANKKGSSQIMERLKKAYKKRVAQASKIIEHSLSSPYEVVICGDFNDIPISYTYHLFEKEYIDAFVNSGLGIGKTYIGKIPSYRIDYVFHSDGIESYEFKVHPEELSDHRAVSTYISIK